MVGYVALRETAGGKMEAKAPDDFPTNAFALLPPSPQSEGAEVWGDGAKRVEEEEGLEVVENVRGDDACLEDSMVMLKFNLAHTELHEVIESLYRAIDVTARKNSELEHENTRLATELGSARGQVEKINATMRQQLDAQDEAMQSMQRKLRELEQCKERLSAELVEVKTKLEEKEGVITQLDEALHVLQENLCRNRQAGMVKRVQQEVKQLTDVWSTKEKCVTESTEHVRNAAVAVQRLSQQLQSQLHHVRAELMDSEKEYSMIRAFMKDHRCDGSLVNTKDSSKEQILVEVIELQKRVHSLQAKGLQTASQNKALQIRCTEYQKTIMILKRKIEELQQKEASNKALVAKYEGSAADGTETIAEMQEALIKLCDQLTHERTEHHTKLKEQLRQGVKRETELQESLDEALERLRRVEEAQKDVSAPPCERCKSHEKSQTFVCRDEYNEVPHITPSLGENTEVNVECGMEIRSQLEKPREGRNEAIREVNQAAKSCSSKIKVTSTEVTCRICREEPFGFMVRCQKCKSPFHAGCVKNSASGTKRRLGRIFKCNDCVPQRPTKVARQSEATDVEPLPVKLLPSRTPMTHQPIARPSSQPNSS